MRTASNSSSALAPRTGFVYPYSRGAVGQMSNASNLSTTWANVDYSVTVKVIDSSFKKIVKKTMFEVLMTMPLAQLESILDRRRRED